MVEITALNQLKGLIVAMVDMQEREGKRATIQCSIMEKALKEVVEKLETK